MRDASSLTGGRIRIDMGSGWTGSADALTGNNAAGAAAWHAGVQQSIFARSEGLLGILPSIAQPGMSLACTAAPLAVTGASASPSAARNEINSRITRSTLNGDAERSPLTHSMLPRKNVEHYQPPKVARIRSCTSRFLLSGGLTLFGKTLNYPGKPSPDLFGLLQQFRIGIVCIEATGSIAATSTFPGERSCTTTLQGSIVPRQNKSTPSSWNDWIKKFANLIPLRARNHGVFLGGWDSDFRRFAKLHG